ncbi:MAG: hypothetical protein R3D88_05370 [Alphaproteobacteria bacterium]|nr:hypothetical protein [Alphaproteobacteria bacterium]
MKNILLSTLLLVSTIAVSACTSNGTAGSDLDGTLTQAPYAEERTVGSSGTPAPVMRSAAPVFESRQVK